MRMMAREEVNRGLQVATLPGGSLIIREKNSGYVTQFPRKEPLAT